MISGVKPDGGLEQHLHLGGEGSDRDQAGLTHLGSEHVGQAGRGPPQGDPPEEEDGQHHIGEQGREVNHLSRAGYTLKLQISRA